MKMGLREANQNFSKAVKAIKEGKVIILTERGTPIATIRPIEDGKAEQDELQSLADEGFLITPAASKRRKQTKPLRIPRGSLSRALREERDEER